MKVLDLPREGCPPSVHTVQPGAWYVATLPLGQIPRPATHMTLPRPHVKVFPGEGGAADDLRHGVQVDPKLLQGNAARSGMYRSVFRSVKGILKHEGVRGFYRGVAAMALGAGPAHAVRDALTEYGARRIFFGEGRRGCSMIFAPGLSFLQTFCTVQDMLSTVWKDVARGEYHHGSWSKNRGEFFCNIWHGQSASSRKNLFESGKACQFFRTGT